MPRIKFKDVNKMTKIGARKWFVFVLIGLVGQFAWTLENMYFNVFLYNTISQDTSYIATMVAASAITATLTTLLMGVLSDRIGKRKPFICGGYIIWGIITGLFGFITVENITTLFAGATVATAAMMVVIMDCLMTFFGSTANDAAFNAYVTDTTDTSNRGKAESVLAIMPLVSMLIIFGLFAGLADAGNWKLFFLIFGTAVTITGIISIFLIKDSRPEKQKGGIKNLLYGFTPSVIKSNSKLYLALCSLGIFSIAVQVFFPYLIIYMEHTLKIDYTLALGSVLIFASLVSVLSGRIIDKVGKLKFSVPAIFIMALGLVAMFFVARVDFIAVELQVMIAGAVMMSGYMLVSAALGAVVRDYTPDGKAGHFQGIRMIFAVMLPMVTGPYIGSLVIKLTSSTGETYEELGSVKEVPTGWIYLAAAAVLILTLIPLIALIKKEKNEKEPIHE